MLFPTPIFHYFSSLTRDPTKLFGIYSSRNGCFSRKTKKSPGDLKSLDFLVSNVQRDSKFRKKKLKRQKNTLSNFLECITEPQTAGREKSVRSRNEWTL